MKKNKKVEDRDRREGIQKSENERKEREEKIRKEQEEI
jgi:hypothetical protein